jgi:hypothetical protein
MENKFVELQNRVLQTFSSTAEQRYLSFWNNTLICRVGYPIHKLPHIWALHQEFLSKIRKDITKK